MPFKSGTFYTKKLIFKKTGINHSKPKSMCETLEHKNDLLRGKNVAREGGSEKETVGEKNSKSVCVCLRKHVGERN